MFQYYNYKMLLPVATTLSPCATSLYYLSSILGHSVRAASALHHAAKKLGLVRRIRDICPASSSIRLVEKKMKGTKKYGVICDRGHV
jgi:hypothetical protein